MAGKPMTAQRMREVAAQMMKAAQDKADHTRTAQAAAKLAKERGSITVGPNTFSADDMERYAKIAADQAAEWSIVKVWAKELQEHSFTMKG